MILAGSHGFYSVTVRRKIMEALGGRTGRMLMIPFAASDTAGAVRERTGAVMAGFRQEDVLIYGLDGGKELMEQDYEFISVPGGNTFRLLSRMREEGLDSFIREQYNNGAVYLGFSAGACIACPDIEYVRNFDDNIDINDGNFTALGLTDNYLLCHFDFRGTPEILMCRRFMPENAVILTINEDQLLVL